LFHPYGRRDRFARATLSTCALLFPEEDLPLSPEDVPEHAIWWLGLGSVRVVPGHSKNQLFPQSGIASISADGAHILMDAGPFGFGGAGHSHADTLSITARAKDRELLIDPGTFTYVGDLGLRNEFRSTGFHNTIRLNGLDQAAPGGPFRWEAKPVVAVNQWLTDERNVFLDASCGYRGFTHRRRTFVVGGEMILVLDEVIGPEGTHDIEQFWHLGDGDVAILFSDPEALQFEDGLRSRVFGERETAPVIRASWRKALPHVCGTAIALREIEWFDSLISSGLELSIPGVLSVSFAEPGMPKVRRS
jgi:hypothetical protein